MVTISLLYSLNKIKIMIQKLIDTIKESTNEVFTKPELLELILSLTKVQSLIQSNGFILNPNNNSVVNRNNNSITLVRKEFKLLMYLINHSNVCVSRSQILKDIWGEDIVVGERTIDVHIRKIKAKTGIDCIQTLKGIGYMWVTN
jgi:DNA-binding response OmpR family regulator